MIMSLAESRDSTGHAGVAGTGRHGARRMHALIVSADAASRQRLRQLAGQEPDIGVIEECGDAEEAAQCFHAFKPDVAIIEVGTPQLDGFAVADAVRHLAPPPLFIFVSCSAEHAMRAFRAAALDFLMHPVQPLEFGTAIHRARGALADQSSAAVGQTLASLLGLDARAAGGVQLHGSAARPAPGYLERIPVRNDDRVVYVRSRDVTHFEAHGNYVRLHVGKKPLQIRQTLGALEQQLDPRRFVRIHRRTIVNVDAVRELQPWFAADYVVLLDDGTALRLSRTFREQFGIAMSRGR